MAISQRQCRSLIYRYLLNEGWLPRGTTTSSWRDVTLAEIDFDDPPLENDPHFQKKRVALDLQNLFFVLGSDLASPLGQLKRGESTLVDLADWCAENNE